MIGIFTNKITPRINYTFELIFRHILGLEFEIITDPQRFLLLENPKFSYAEKALDKELFFYNSGFLLEKSIDAIQFEVYEYKKLNAFFAHDEPNSVWPFDPFALSFFLSSRYEEYLPAKRDQHGRFSAQESIAYKHGFLQLPLIDLWAQRLGKLLKDHFPSLQIKKREFSFIPSYDIDHAWAFKHKGLLRTSANFIKDVAKLDFGKVKFRTAVLLGKKTDPFHLFQYLEECFKYYSLNPLFFFLVGKYGTYDKNVSLKKLAFQEFIRSMAQKYNIGIHPSYRANSTHFQLKKEIAGLAKVTDRNITKSRQHYLLLRFPDTYRRLIDLGVTDDFTMGYAQDTGFRASLSIPFPWYDLKREESTSLMLHPFQVMDVTLRNYLKLTPEEAIQRIKELLDTTKSVNGTFISLWHNNSLSEYEEWVGWRKVHDYLISHV